MVIKYNKQQHIKVTALKGLHYIIWLECTHTVLTRMRSTRALLNYMTYYTKKRVIICGGLFSHST